MLRSLEFQTDRSFKILKRAETWIEDIQKKKKKKEDLFETSFNQAHYIMLHFFSLSI